MYACVTKVIPEPDVSDLHSRSQAVSFLFSSSLHDSTLFVSRVSFLECFEILDLKYFVRYGRWRENN
ncbi:unnamed protein product [Brassica oleracea]